MDVLEDNREQKPNIKTEIKQENDIFSSMPPEAASQIEDEPWLVDLSKIKSEPEHIDEEIEDGFFITPTDLSTINNTNNIKTEGDPESDTENDDDDEEQERRRKKIAKLMDKPCPYCDKIFSDSYKLKKHVMDHTGERPFNCDMCDSAFKEKYSLTVHIKTHTGDRQISCPECDKTFIVPSALKAHMRTHSKEKPFVCDICGRGFSHSANLKPHMATHSEEFPFHCLECGKSFRIRKGLLRHIRGHHANCTKEGCEFCAEFDKTKYKPRKYVKVPEKIRECPICLQTFRYYMTFKNHMRAHNNENYTCSFCGKAYLDRAALRVHLRNHTGETPYVCGVCGKKFKRGDSYRYHISTHNEERKLYTCDICKQDYTHRSSLLKHKRHVHDDERPFKCELCNRCFKTPQVLKGHMRTHRDEGSKLPDPEICRLCSKTIDKRGYKAHMKTHGIETFKCKKCRVVFEGQESFNSHKAEGCTRYKSGQDDTAPVKSVSPNVSSTDIKMEATEAEQMEGDVLETDSMLNS